jgi:DNA primase
VLRFEPVRRSGAQWYGRCPLHGSSSNRNLPFSVNVATGRYCCHQCKSHGNQIELWAAATNLPLYHAAIDLCHTLGCEVPWIRRW